MHSLLQKMSEPINGKTNSELELTSMISNLHNLIKRTDLVISGHHNDTDSKRINYLSKNSYISAVEMASKLAWFLEIYCALSNHAKK